ncbi:uncharacterized protein LOC112340855 [Selaginella moellendorffii]|uniref:uncharacterized protein LOC112340855 n=1 Tax=Selaginella moellendorffii TaxID=88036 RepID=UPI000D1C43D9|nr:uncharacterized protein LOC112340855 [Selaginella moellendorffii]|eukprot:XP_024515751.1 uncharacterized protein LOC112340855 [Selaginella moellendorffii]
MQPGRSITPAATSRIRPHSLGPEIFLADWSSRHWRIWPSGWSSQMGRSSNALPAKLPPGIEMAIDATGTPLFGDCCFSESNTLLLASPRYCSSCVAASSMLVSVDVYALQRYMARTSSLLWISHSRASRHWRSISCCLTFFVLYAKVSWIIINPTRLWSFHPRRHEKLLPADIEAFGVDGNESAGISGL